MAGKELTLEDETFKNVFTEFDASEVDRLLQKIAALKGKGGAFENSIYSCYITKQMLF